MMEIFEALIENWIIAAIATLIGMILAWMFETVIPRRWHPHKRLIYASKVEAAVGNIEISIPTNNQASREQIRNALSDFLKSEDTIVGEGNRNVNFNSVRTGSSYKIKSSSDEDNHFLIIECFSAFNVGFFGNIKNIKNTIEELQDIVSSLADFRSKELSATIMISVTPRKKTKTNDKLNMTHTERIYTTVCDAKNIKITNKGFVNIEKNIKEVFYEWMYTFL